MSCPRRLDNRKKKKKRRKPKGNLWKNLNYTIVHAVKYGTRLRQSCRLLWQELRDIFRRYYSVAESGIKNSVGSAKDRIVSFTYQNPELDVRWVFTMLARWFLVLIPQRRWPLPPRMMSTSRVLQLRNTSNHEQLPEGPHISFHVFPPLFRRWCRILLVLLRNPRFNLRLARPCALFSSNHSTLLWRLWWVLWHLFQS